MGNINIDQNQKEIIDSIAKELRVKADIHEADFIYWFVVGQIPEYKKAIDYYFKDGRNSAEKLKNLLVEYNLLKNDIEVLEFASGYGCVTRHFSNVFPELSVTSCDIHDEAINFITDNFGIRAVLSSSLPEELKLDCKYDVIFALSFFSHMPKTTWTRWVGSLLSNVKEGGILILTTHGMESRKYLNSPQIEADGFWFKDFSEQKDLESSEYGSTIVHPTFVFGAIEDLDGEIICFKHAFWWGHQDLYILKKNSNKSKKLKIDLLGRIKNAFVPN